MTENTALYIVIFISKKKQAQICLKFIFKDA